MCDSNILHHRRTRESSGCFPQEAIEEGRHQIEKDASAAHHRQLLLGHVIAMLAAESCAAVNIIVTIMKWSNCRFSVIKSQESTVLTIEPLIHRSFP
jgi:hypothetical protein